MLDADPWAEQALRHERYRHVSEQRRRRRYRRAVVVLATVLSVALLVATAVIAARWSVERQTATAGEAHTTVAPSTVRAFEEIGSVDLSVDDVPRQGPAAVEVAEVWLLDRGDGRFDWGTIIESDTEDTLASLSVAVVFLDGNGGQIRTETVVLPTLNPGGRVPIGGVSHFDLGAEQPVRVQVNASLGVLVDSPSSEVASASISITDVERVGSGQLDAADLLIGRIDSDPAFDLDEVSIAALWRDDAGSVVGAVFASVGGVAGETDTAFEVQLDRGVVPLGDPDEVLWAR